MSLSDHVFVSFGSSILTNVSILVGLRVAWLDIVALQSLRRWALALVPTLQPYRLLPPTSDLPFGLGLVTRLPRLSPVLYHMMAVFCLSLQIVRGEDQSTVDPVPN